MTDKIHPPKSNDIPSRGGSPIWMSKIHGSDHNREMISTSKIEKKSGGKGIENINNSINKGQNDVEMEIHSGSLISKRDMVGDHDLTNKNDHMDVDPDLGDIDKLNDLNVLGRSRSGSDIIFYKEDGSILPEREYPVNIILREKQQLDGYIIGIQNSVEQDLIWVMVRGEPIFKDNGEIERVALYSMDITELKNDQLGLEQKRIELEGTVGRISSELEVVKDSISHVGKYDSKIQLLSKTGSFEYDPISNEIKGSKMFNRLLEIDDGSSIDLDTLLSRLSEREMTSFKRILGETRKDGVSKVMEISYSIDEDIVPLLVKIVSHSDPVDEREIVIGIIQDISHEKFTKSRIDRMSKEIENINKVMIDRESRVIEIKEEVNELCKELGREPRYKNL